MKEKVCTLSDIRRLYVRKKENFNKVVLDDLVEKMVEKDNVKT